MDLPEVEAVARHHFEMQHNPSFRGGSPSRKRVRVYCVRKRHTFAVYCSACDKLLISWEASPEQINKAKQLRITRGAWERYLRTGVKPWHRSSTSTNAGSKAARPTPFVLRNDEQTTNERFTNDAHADGLG